MALTLRGATAHAHGRHDVAAREFRRLTRLEPDAPAHWLNFGTALRALGRYDEALAAYARAHALGGVTADFCFNVGLTHLDRLDFESARAVLAQGAALAPQDGEMRLQYAKACFESGHTDAGLAALDGWQHLPLAAGAVAEIGQRLQGAGESGGAAAVIERLRAAGRASDPGARLALVQMLERANRLDEAEAEMARLRAALVLPGPAHASGPDLASGLAATEGRLAQRAGRHQDAIAHFEYALALDAQPHRRHHELFPLARSLDALGRHDEAWARLGEAHRSQVAQVRMAAPALAVRGAPTFALATHATGPDDLAGWSDEGAPTAEASPVFIVAFPRSGTTLLEQVLDAHPDLCAMDEQPFLQRALEELDQAAGGGYPVALARVGSPELAAIRNRYLERAQRKAGLSPGRRFVDQRLVDKNPLNLLRLPAIRRLFPHSRILLAVRHPCDVLLSCHMQHFTAPEFALLSADLPSLASGYRRAFDGWYREQAALGPAVREVRYEALVRDFEREVRAIAAFLGLRWSDALLAPGAHARGKAWISTPSYARVVQPVDTRAIGRWRAYAQHFAPVLPLLAPYLGRWGYEAA
ncbi:MAG: sulfotransferase [Steroidobacteraceae bacterium]